MRILVLAPQPFFQHRGTPIAVKAVVSVLADQGHHLDVLAYHEGEEIPIPRGRIHRIPAIPGVRNLRPGFSIKKVVCDLVMFWRSLGLARRGTYDLIHAVEESVFMAMTIRWLFGTPYVYDMDSSLAVQMLQQRRWLRPARRAFELMERLAVRQSLGVLAVCRSLEETARKCAPDKAVVRLEDVSLLDHDEAAGAAPAPAAETPVVMYVGNLEPYQGIDLLLESFRIAAQGAPDARLVIVGGVESDITRYADRAGRLGIGEKVEFLGQRPIAELGAHLARATVLVSPRIRGNNTPMKIYSYLDSGRPVLATRLPMHEEVLDDSIAYLADAEPTAMSAGLVALLRDPELRSGLAARAKERVAAEYSPASFRSKLVSFYQGLPIGPGTARTRAALQLFRWSVLKQAKLRELVAVMGRSDGKRCLDIGGDSGIISLMLRRQGGRWWSADLDETSVRSIHDLVGGCVARMSGRSSPFRTTAFDLVVIVDFLEHTVTDREFLVDMRRILKPGGDLIIHVPLARPRAMVNRLRTAIGLTDERHGHVRPGYTLGGLRQILPPGFVIEHAGTYSRACSELIETTLSFAYDRVRRPDRRPPGSPSKGPIVTAGDAAAHPRRFVLLGLAYPILWAIAQLDRLLFFDEGYRLVVKARLQPGSRPPGGQ
ncbi:MAG TPA: glycosyltransferase [Candidatus Eisenbacteria bacterium]|jgi:glycosyltransferase involved in cell wall biosynthesis